MSFGCIVNTNFFDSFFSKEACDNICHLLRISVHGTEHDHDPLVCVVLAPLVIFGHDVGNVGATNRSVGCAYHFDRKTTEFFQCGLGWLTVFPNNVGIITADFLFQVI